MKRNHEAYATCERHDDAKPGINANKTADGVDNVVDSPIFNMCLIVSNRVEGLTNPAGAGSDEDTSSLDAGAEKPGPNRECCLRIFRSSSPLYPSGVFLPHFIHPHTPVTFFPSFSSFFFPHPQTAFCL